MNLYYLHYNNYYNRIVKKFDTLGEYLTLPYYDNLSTENVAFNPNDGTETEQIVNIQSASFGYDYAILADGNNIVSRWFILKSKRLRNGQYRLNLRRDLFADLLPDVVDAPAFIEKGTLEYNDPLIFNSEDMTFNQIKTSETLLKDETGCPWIVGYFARNNANNQRQDYSISFTPKTPIDLYANDGIENWDFYKYTFNYGDIFFKSPNLWYMIRYKKDVGTGRYLQKFNKNGILSETSDSSFTNSTLIYPNDRYTGSYQDLAEQLNQHIGKYADIHTEQEYIDFLNLNGKVIYDSLTDKIYRIGLVSINSNFFAEINENTPNLYSIFKSAMPNGNDSSFLYGWDSSFGYKIILSEINENTSYTLNISDRFSLSNAPYDMFCMPYADGIELFQNGILKCTSSKEIAFGAAMEFARVYGNDGNAKFLYDIQLLPYCPARWAIQDGTLDVGNNDLGVAYITQSNDASQRVCPVLFVSSDNFTLNIGLEEPIEIKEPKIESQCDMYRLCSPNYNGVFEFNAAKNGGVSYFNVDCTYKPYNPYIHVNPNFGRLYGNDFNDSRGLVVGGDFSMPQTTSAWESYQLSNKNFQASFDRQIENMEVNNAIQNIQTATKAVTGTLGGILGGFMAGGVGGAIAGGTASAIGGAMDYALQRASQAEAIDYTKDQFGYSLGNIKAMAQGLAKTSALVFNNKLFPFLEYYTCTEEEKEALRNKIKYNGMTVMRIGTIREFMKSEPTYIKGKLIRVTTAPEDYNYVNELANEFNKGVFI